MSALTERRPSPGTRRGVALLLALVTLGVLSVCLLALWQTRAGALRSDRLRAAVLRRSTQADSMLALGVDAVHSGAWRGLTQPGVWIRTHQHHATDAHLTTTVARLGWGTLLVRGLATGRSGVRRVPARADQRLLIPLRAPMRLPEAALTGGTSWTVHAGATVGVATASPLEQQCRDGVLPQVSRLDSMAVALDPTQVTLLDPDTVSTPLVGVFRLIRDRIRRPMVVTGMVESVTGLFVEADLQIVGVLVAQGSVQPAGGRLDVTGAVITRDSGGAGSELGHGDRVQYDACAIRRAMERATRPAPAVTWTSVGLP